MFFLLSLPQSISLLSFLSYLNISIFESHFNLHKIWFYLFVLSQDIAKQIMILIGS